MPDPLIDQDNLVDTATSRDRTNSLTLAAVERVRQALLADSYAFTRVVCGHKDLVPAIHMPISYLVAGLTDRLIECLELPTLNGYVTRKLREELRRHQVQWTTPAGRKRLHDLLNGTMLTPAVLNIRMSRRFFKSSVITHGGTLYIATVDPNQTIKITHAVDPKAFAFCEQIGRTVMSGAYRAWFPDRAPDDKGLVTQRRITLKGRTISHPQTNIEASGYLTKEESAHYSTMLDDDLVTDLNSSPDLLVGVRQFLKRRTGYYMPTRPIRVIGVGTKHDEDDDDTYFTEIANCITIRVPIEEHRTRKIVNILERGIPTCPELFPVEKINAEQQHVLSGEEDEDGYKVWWNQYLLSATGGSLRLFPADIADDPDRQWLGPFKHPNDNWHRRGHFLIARYRRDLNGNPLSKPNHTVRTQTGELREDWHPHAAITSIDPWEEMDRVICVDPSWSERSDSDNWAVSAVGKDYEDIKYQLQTMSDTTGIEGWISALDWMMNFWQPRCWGIDATAAQDPFIENLIRTDKRLRRIASRMIKIHHSTKAKALRLQEGVSQPLNVYRFLLAPTYTDHNGRDRFGGTMTRSELKLIKSTPRQSVRTDQDGIADSLAMSGTVLRAGRRKFDGPDIPQPAALIDPYTGLPLRR